MSRYPGILTDAESQAVAPYTFDYRVEPGVEDWGWAVAVWHSGDDHPAVTRVRRHWYERPKYQSPCAPRLLSKIYLTESDADAAWQTNISRCEHTWTILSHEESVCRKCGDIRFHHDD